MIFGIHGRFTSFPFVSNCHIDKAHAFNNLPVVLRYQKLPGRWKLFFAPFENISAFRWKLISHWTHQRFFGIRDHGEQSADLNRANKTIILQTHTTFDLWTECHCNAKPLKRETVGMSKPDAAEDFNSNSLHISVCSLRLFGKSFNKSTGHYQRY